MKKIVFAITIFVVLIITACTSYMFGYYHVINNQYVSEYSDYKNTYYIVVNDHMYSYVKD